MFKHNRLTGLTQFGEKKKTKDQDYEEIGPQRKKVDRRIVFCELCGSVAAAVRCDKCNGQAFCFSCDDMYHKHPKRSAHSRKALDATLKETKSGGIRPPLPPKGTEVQLASPPQPPPRRNKRPGFLPGSSSKKDQPNDSSKSLMGSIRRIMGNRPLPPTPDQEKVFKDADHSVPYSTNSLTRSKKSQSTLNEDNSLAPSNSHRMMVIPQTIIDLNSVNQAAVSKIPTSLSSQTQYPKIQPKSQRNRKLSLQQFPSSVEDKRASMVEAPQNSWDKQPQAHIGQKGRSQSISNEQWNQVMAMQGPPNFSGPTTFNTNTSSNDLATTTPSKQSLSTMSNVGMVTGPPTRGMVSSTSVCDLNSMAQHQHQHQVQSYPPNMPTANSFQHLSLMGYDNQMMWMPPCAACQSPMMYPSSISSGGMKRATSNISMNHSSAGSDAPGYPWSHQNAHMHHHMPMYPQPYFPQGGGCHQHMISPMPMRGSTMSIPDTMRSFNRMPSSPAPSTRSTSHRSHKSSKSQSSEVGRRSRKHSRRRSDQDSGDSTSSSFSDRDEPIHVVTPSSKNKRTGLAWQCDHCTFINSGSVHTCGMCSKQPGIKERINRRGSDRRRTGRHKKIDYEDNASDYDNDKRRESKSEARLKSSGSMRSTKSRNKSNRQHSYSPSVSDSNEDEGIKIERQLKDLRITGRIRDYDCVSRAKVEHGSLKREGGGRYRNRRRFQSERSRTPARSTRSSPARRSRRTSFEYDDKSHFLKRSTSSSSSDHILADQKSSLEGTLVGTNQSNMKTVGTDLNNRKREDSESLKLSDCSDAEIPIEQIEVPEDNREVERQLFPPVFEEMKSEKIEHVQINRKTYEEMNQLYSDQNLDVKSSTKDFETEEPSFANTLDGIETLMTNEVADIDPNSQYLDDRASGTDIPIHDLDDIPILKYIVPKDYSEKSQVLDIEDKSKINDRYNTIQKRTEQISEMYLTQQPDPEYEDVEKPIIIPEEKLIDQPISVDHNDQDIYQRISYKNAEIIDQESSRESRIEAKDVDALEFLSTSSESLRSGHRFTPLSFSSSDALFYSPPDSPELSEKLRIKLTQTDRHTIEDDLVTALESIDNSMEDLKSSRETIRSSIDQLPSSDEAFEYEESKDIRERPSSVTLISPSIADDGTACYDTLSFQDAVSHPEPASSLKRSVSEQMNDLQPMDLTMKERKKVLTVKDEIDESQLSVKEIIVRRKQKAMKQHGLELVQILREAEALGYNPEDVSVALKLSKDKSPVEWLEENWRHMVDTVATLASNYGRDRKMYDIGEITATEAKAALRIHKGNVWDAVTECVEVRQKKFNKIYSSGNFKRRGIIQALQDNEGDDEGASFELQKSQQSGSFFKKIWAPAEEAMNSVSSLFRRDNKSKIVSDKTSESVVKPFDKDLEVSKPLAKNLDDEFHDRSIDRDDDSENESSFDESHGTISETDNEELNQVESSEFEYKDNVSDVPALNLDVQTRPTENDDINHLLAYEIKQPAEYNLSDIFENPRIADGHDLLYESSVTSTHTYDSVQVKSYTKSLNGDRTPTTNSSEEDNNILAEPQNIEMISKSLTKQHDTSKTANEKQIKSHKKLSKNKHSLKKVVANQLNEATTSKRESANDRNVHKGNGKAVKENQSLKNLQSYKQNTHKLEKVVAPKSEKIKINRPDIHNSNKASITELSIPDEAADQSDLKNSSHEEDLQESTLEESEEESVSVTTGRLSLTVTQTGDKKAKLDVKSQTIITDIIPIKENVSIIDSLESHKEISDEHKAEMGPEFEISLPDDENVDQLGPEDAAKIRATGGPVTVQKASFIVGKAIANAMKRESTVKKENCPGESRSPTLSPTPPATPESEEPLSNLTSIVSSESEDDLLGSLDTIPEEEEISERTRSIVTTESKNKSMTQKSIPPAVASYSGPIFIPSAIQKDGSSSHSYYNIANDNSKNKMIERSTSSDYESYAKSKSSVKKEQITTDQLKTAKEKLMIRNVNESTFKGKSPKQSILKKTPSDGTSKGRPDKIYIAKQKDISNVVDSSIGKESSNSSQKITELVKSSEKSSTSKNNAENTIESPDEPEKSKDAIIENIKAETSSKSSDTSTQSSTIELEQSVKSVVISKNKESPTTRNIGIKSSNDREVEVKSKGSEKIPPIPLLNSSSEYSDDEVEEMEEKGEEQKEEEEDEDDIEEESEENENDNRALELVRGIPRRSSFLTDMILKVEELQKSDDPDYQEVQLLKEQIQQMRRELESEIKAKEESNYESDTTDPSRPPSREKQISELVLSTPEEEKPSSQENKPVDNMQYEKLKFDRTVRRLLAEGQATSYEKAELAAQLLVFSFDETDSIQAAEGCSSIYTALQFLQQECELCAGKYPMGKMISMLHCIHRCCYECAQNYFTFQIKTKNIRELRCPFCNEPDLDNSEETSAEYLNNLDILLKNIVDQETHELFQRKLRDWTLMKDPNFKWCSNCSSGFISNPRARTLICPDCKDVTCASCRKQWEAQHEGISCEDFSKWKEENDPENQAEGVAKHLAENGITCPKCRFTYSLAKGGCMHFTCGECKFEFCSGCNKPFKQGAKCSVGPYCERLGLHAHHPRNCLFYLRDKEPTQLQQLLKDHDISFVVDRPTVDDTARNFCKVMEQKETSEGLIDDECGRFTLDGHAGHCRIHYIEYLVEMINTRGLDPVGIFDEADLRVCLRRNGKVVPVRRWESEKLYRDKLIKLIEEQLPLTIAQDSI